MCILGVECCVQSNQAEPAFVIRGPLSKISRRLKSSIVCGLDFWSAVATFLTTDYCLAFQGPFGTWSRPTLRNTWSPQQRRKQESTPLSRHLARAPTHRSSLCPDRKTFGARHGESFASKRYRYIIHATFDTNAIYMAHPFSATGE